MIELFVNNVQLDLFDGEEVLLTLQANDLSNLQDRNSNFSNVFEVPASSVNLAALGHLHAIEYQDSKPYELLRADILEDGVAIVNNGVAIINSVSESAIEINVYSGLYSLFHLLDKLPVRDLDLSAFDYTWNHGQVFIKNSTAINSGVVYPLVQYGLQPLTGNEFDARVTFPAFFLHTLITEIVTAQGYTLEGDLWTDPFYLTIALLFSERTFARGQRWIDDNSFDFETILQIHADSASFGNTTTETRTYPLSFLGGGGTFTATGNTNMDVTISVDVSNFQILGTLFIDVFLQPFVNGVLQPPAAVILADGHYEATTNLALVAGDVVDVRLRVVFSTTGPGSGSFTLTIAKAGQWFNFGLIEEAEFGAEITPESFLPNLTQKDIIKLAFQELGAYAFVDETKKVLFGHKLDTIHAARPFALDWSDKIVNATSQRLFFQHRGFRFGNYGQVNNFTYLEDDTLEDIEHGNGFFIIADETLDKESNVVEIPLGASEHTLMLEEEQCVKVERFDPLTSEVDQVGKPRIIYIGESSNDVVVIDGVSTSPAHSAAVALFDNKANDTTLNFDSLLESYYAGLVSMMESVVVVQAKFNLTLSDIVELQNTGLNSNLIGIYTPIYIAEFNSYFLINSVDEFKEGTLTNVNLVKIPMDIVPISTTDTYNFRWTGDVGGGTGDAATLQTAATGEYELQGQIFNALGNPVATRNGMILEIGFSFGNDSFALVRFDASNPIIDLAAATPISFANTQLTRNDATTISSFGWDDIKSFVNGSLAGGVLTFAIEKVTMHENGVGQLFGFNANQINVGCAIEYASNQGTGSIAPFELVESYDAFNLATSGSTTKNGLFSLSHSRYADGAVALKSQAGTWVYEYQGVGTEAIEYTYPDGTSKDWEVWTIGNDVKTINYVGEDIAGVLKLDTLTRITNFMIGSNEFVTSVPLPTSTETVVNFDATLLENVTSFDFSGLDMAGKIILNNCTLLDTLTQPAGTNGNSITQISWQNCAFVTILLNHYTNLSNIIQLFGNPSTSVNFGASANFIGNLDIRNMPNMTTVDVSGYHKLGGSIRGSNSGTTTLTLSSVVTGERISIFDFSSCSITTINNFANMGSDWGLNGTIVFLQGGNNLNTASLDQFAIDFNANAIPTIGSVANTNGNGPLTGGILNPPYDDQTNVNGWSWTL